MKPSSEPTASLSVARGRLCIALAAVMWSTSGAFTKLLTKDTPLGLHLPEVTPQQIAFFRVLFAGSWCCCRLCPARFHLSTVDAGHGRQLRVHERPLRQGSGAGHRGQRHSAPVHRTDVDVPGERLVAGREGRPPQPGRAAHCPVRHRCHRLRRLAGSPVGRGRPGFWRAALVMQVY